MKTTHTPGPWAVDYETSEVGPLVWSKKPEKQIAQAFDGPNARLLAAAPDLLAALENLADMYRDEFENDREIAGADFLQDFADLRPALLSLIAKARGHE